MSASPQANPSRFGHSSDRDTRVDTATGQSLAREGGWLVVSDRSADTSRANEFGAPGLWRSLRDASGSTERIFEIAPSVRAVYDYAAETNLEEYDAGDDSLRPWIGSDHAPDPDDPDRDLLAWAAETARGGAGLDPGAPIAAEELAAWLPAARRRVRAGSLQSQVEIVIDAQRVALVIPALVRIPEALAEERLAWLAALCDDAMSKWRLVRFGIDAERASVCAEVDLTGAPRARARALFELSLAALTSAAAWALPAFACASDLAAVSQLLDRGPLPNEASAPRTSGNGQNTRQESPHRKRAQRAPAPGGATKRKERR